MQKAYIIGAGPAGLTAAYELIKHGYDVTTLKKVRRSAAFPKRYAIRATAWIWAVIAFSARISA